MTIYIILHIHDIWNLEQIYLKIYSKNISLKNDCGDRIIMYTIQLDSARYDEK